MYQKRNNTPLLIIMENLYSDYKSNEKFKNIIFNAKGYNMSLIIIENKFPHIPPDMRANIDIIIPQKYRDNELMHKLYNLYFDMFDTYELFKNTIDSLDESENMVGIYFGRQGLKIEDKIKILKI
jgi:hypothetical protein